MVTTRPIERMTGKELDAVAAELKLAGWKPRAKVGEKRARIRAAQMTVTAAVERELKQLATIDRSAAMSALAAATLALARRIDEPESSAAEVASCSRALRLVLEDLRPGVAMPMPDPVEEDERDRVDELAARRATAMANVRSRR